MKFLVDQNLPTGLLPILSALGHDAVHVKLMGLAEATDEALWTLASQDDRVVISKDSDFLILARRRPEGALLRLVLGNCSNITLYEVVRRELSLAVARLDRGERIVEIRP
ncbi:MAG: DUF5615 family PIN-like protein [Caulobacteraceae bacterium]|nr:DUF5615 family PIN-like protein [Caulobacteraceae bacterium]